MSTNSWTLLANLHEALEVAKDEHKSSGDSFLYKASEHFQTLVAAALIKGSVDESLVNQADIFAESLMQLDKEVELRDSARKAMERSLIFARMWPLEDPAFRAKESDWHKREVARSAQVAVEDIMILVANFYNVEVQDLEGPSRDIRHVFPRQVAMYLIRELTFKSFPQIGRSFGNRDHTTVLYAYRRLIKLREEDEQVDKELNELAQLLRAQRGDL